MEYITKNKFGLFSIAITSSTPLDLATLLDPEISLVHICGYRPKASSNWWNAELPFWESGASKQARIRMLAFDVEMPTHDFLHQLAHFCGGLDLLQTRKSVPPNIVPQLFPRAGQEELARVLIAAGMESRYTLPHPGEVATFASRSRPRLEHVLENENLRSRCVGAN